MTDILAVPDQEVLISPGDDAIIQAQALKTGKVRVNLQWPLDRPWWIPEFMWKPTKWIRLSPERARIIAEDILKMADVAEGKDDGEDRLG